MHQARFFSEHSVGPIRVTLQQFSASKPTSNVLGIGIDLIIVTVIIM